MFSEKQLYNPTRVRTYSLALATMFFFIGLWLVPHHEMWRDEIQAWLLARDSANITELFANLKYDGHPGLWHLLLMPLTRTFASPIVMQYFHMLIATGSVYLLARYSPFGWPQKILLALSYYLFYEYSLISRNYSIGVFLVFVVCTLFPARSKRPIAIAITLFLLSHTNVLGTILAIGLSISILVERHLELKSRELSKQLEFKNYLALIIVAAGIVSAVLQLKPPSDSGFAPGWQLYPDLHLFNASLNTIANAYFPLVTTDLHYWNQPPPLFQATVRIIAIVCLLVYAKFLFNRPAAGLFFILTTLALLAFFYAKYVGSMRHHGYLFLTLIVALWIAPSCSKIDYSRSPTNRDDLASPLIQRLCFVILIIQSLGGCVAALNDVKYVFSQSKDVARFITENNLDNLPIIADPSAPTSAIAGYLKPSRFFYPDANRYGTFIRWDNKRVSPWSHRKKVTDMWILSKASELTKRNHQDCLIILNHRLHTEALSGLKVLNIYNSGDAVVRDETFHVYRLKK